MLNMLFTSYCGYWSQEEISIKYLMYIGSDAAKQSVLLGSLEKCSLQNYGIVVRNQRIAVKN